MESASRGGVDIKDAESRGGVSNRAGSRHQGVESISRYGVKEWSQQYGAESASWDVGDDMLAYGRL